MTDRFAIDETISAPLWRRLADSLRARIESGEIPPNAALPSEHTIIDEFSVSRNTARRAIAFLRELGLVETHQGRAATVRGDAVFYAISDQTSFASQIAQAGHDLGIVFGETEVIPATVGLARVLRLALGDPVTFLSARTIVDGATLSIGRIFHPSDRFPDIAERRRKHLDPREAFSSYGVHEIHREATRVTARIASPSEAKVLCMSAPEPVLASRKIDCDEAGVPVEFNETLFVARRINLYFPRVGRGRNTPLEDVDMPPLAEWDTG